MTDREKIIAWLRDDTHGDRVAAYRTLRPGEWLLLVWSDRVAVVGASANYAESDWMQHDQATLVLPPSGPWEPAPAKVVWRGSGETKVVAFTPDGGSMSLCTASHLTGDDDIFLDTKLIEQFGGSPFKVTIEADGVGAHTESSPADIIDPTGLFQAFKVIAYHNPEAPEDMPAHVTPEQTAALRLILDEVQEWL